MSKSDEVEYRSSDPDSVISMVRVEKRTTHDVVQLWNRGGHAGVLTVLSDDGMEIAKMLIHSRPRKTP